MLHETEIKQEIKATVHDNIAGLRGEEHNGETKH